MTEIAMPQIEFGGLQSYDARPRDQALRVRRQFFSPPDAKRGALSFC